MRSTFLLIGMWIIGSGVVAYVGDYLGRRMGKRRLTLWGLRPRHTAILFTILTGMFIAGVTLFAMAQLDETVRMALFRVEDLLSTERTLKHANQGLVREKTALVSSRDSARREAADAQRQAALARQGVAKARRGLQAAQRELQAAQRESASLVKEVEVRRAELTQVKGTLLDTETRLKSTRARLLASQARVREANAELAKRTEELTKRKAELALALQDLREAGITGLTSMATEILVRSTSISYPLGEEIRRAVIWPESERSVREALEHLLEAAASSAQQHGAVARPGRRAVELVPQRLSQGSIEEAGQIDRWAHEIWRRRQEIPSVVVRVISVINSIQGEPALATLQVHANRLVYRRGESVCADLVDGRQSEAKILESVLSLLKNTVRARALGNGLLEQPNGEVGQAEWGDVLQLVRSVRERGGLVTVHARAAGDVWTGDPLLIHFTTS